MWTVPRVMAVPRTDLWLGRLYTNPSLRTHLHNAKNVCSTPYPSASFVLFHATLSDMSLVKRQPSQKGVNPFLKEHVVVGWLPWEADSEMETDVLEVYWGVILRTSFLKGVGSRSGQRKNLNCNAVATETWAIWQGPLELWWPFRVVLHTKLGLCIPTSASN